MNYEAETGMVARILHKHYGGWPSATSTVPPNKGVGGRLAASWFRIHLAERRVGQALPLVIAFTRLNGA